jgi:hypothetical protein
VRERQRVADSGDRAALGLAGPRSVKPRAAWPREVRSSGARGQLYEQIGQGDVGPEPLDQALTAVVPGSTAALAIDANDGMRELAKRM